MSNKEQPISKSRPVTKKTVQKNNAVVEYTRDQKLQLLEEYKAKLPEYLEERKKEFLDLLPAHKEKVAVDDMGNQFPVPDKKMDIMELYQYTFSPMIRVAGTSPAYSEEQIAMVFDYFKYVISEANKVALFPPTKESFCSLLGISTHKMNGMKSTGSEEMRDIIMQIEDYISNFLTVGGLTGKVREITAIFTQKSSLGRKEETEVQPLFQQNNTIVSPDQFKEMMKRHNIDA